MTTTPASFTAWYLLVNSLSLPLTAMFKYQLVLENKYKCYHEQSVFPLNTFQPSYPWWATILLYFSQVAMTRDNLTNRLTFLKSSFQSGGQLYLP